MSGTVTVKQVIIGEGEPKICVPLVGVTADELKEEAEALKSLECDVVEWRVDFFEQAEDIEAVKAALAAIRSVIPDLPLLFTFRSAREGGEKEISTEYYAALNQAIAGTRLVDLIDVELFTGDETVKALIDGAHKQGVFVVVSNHDFDKTPDKEEIIFRLRKAQELGGDIPKIAVMPNHPLDVLTLLEATHIMKEKYADRPVITMSMSGIGVISRLAGEVFGSALTFGAAKKASAPGQIAVSELRQVLSLLHRSQ
ncbi:type I 3-dehydroquinate dehydratase [Paenibacillus sp. 7124]|uniref:3-dehydroquinate dehydratase n=1 Tax=Paenibacillus apii TaxID=1850370 RepID=A0A6M1PXM8_9BACL|nr:type I 3-dehydroquinate dehydratase [Paenibacillus apii]NGM84951.1 type I 3-dehydroquinate dehydratase [Paenibacillus apii]NJJ41698.1 type I 3-dehydroquinate dehydratase [Paenibacillus apii]